MGIGGIIPGQILQKLQYAPVSPTNIAYTASVAALDTTNLRLTLNAPPSGNVWIVLSGYSVMAAQASKAVSWGVSLDGVISGSTPLTFVASVGAAGAGYDVLTTAYIFFSGLAPGSHTFDWVAQTSAGASGFSLFAGAAAPATMIAMAG